MNLRNLKTLGQRPKGFMLLKIDCAAAWMLQKRWAGLLGFNIQALPIFVSKLFGGVSGQHGNHYCYAPETCSRGFSISSNPCVFRIGIVFRIGMRGLWSVMTVKWSIPARKTWHFLIAHAILQDIPIRSLHIGFLCQLKIWIQLARFSNQFLHE